MLSCFTLPLPWCLVPNVSVHISYTGDVCIFFQKDFCACSFFGIGSGSAKHKQAIFLFETKHRPQQRRLAS
jgi:hypothetical protein